MLAPLLATRRPEDQVAQLHIADRHASPDMVTYDLKNLYLNTVVFVRHPRKAPSHHRF